MKFFLKLQELSVLYLVSQTIGYQCLFYGPDSSIHHIRGSDDVTACRATSDKGPNQGIVSCYWILKTSFKKLLYTQLGSTFVKLKTCALKIQESVCKCRI